MAEKTYPYEEDIPISKLRVDLKNPRLPDVQDSQLDAFHTMAKVQEDKLVALAKHIIMNGLNPAEKFILIPDDEEQFIVLDGNRRLSALRALDSPEIVQGKLSIVAAKQLKQLGDIYPETPIADVPCIVFQDRDQADPWIQLIHDGESGGAGLVKWSAQQRSRYQSRKGKKEFHLQVLDFATEHGDLSEKTRKSIELGKYPSSTLKRALGTPYLREKLGLEKKEGHAFTKYPKNEVLKGLSKMIDDIGSGRINVNHLRTQTDRINYANGLTESEFPDYSTVGDEATPIEEALETVEGSDPDTSPRPRDRRHSLSRKKLIPSSLTFNIDVSRLNDIYIELKRRLLVKDTPNAVAVLLRAFLEMSVDEFVERKRLSWQGNNILSNKIMAVADYMEDKKLLTKQELRPIKRAASDQTDAYSTTTLNGYVHNRRFTPGPDDLKATWDTLQIFFEKIWQ